MKRNTLNIQLQRNLKCPCKKFTVTFLRSGEGKIAKAIVYKQSSNFLILHSNNKSQIKPTIPIAFSVVLKLLFIVGYRYWQSPYFPSLLKIDKPWSKSNYLNFPVTACPLSTRCIEFFLLVYSESANSSCLFTYAILPCKHLA